MVLRGSFSLQLINAKTMQPFQEHFDYTGKAFVRMGANVDFFLRLRQKSGGESGNDACWVYQTFVSNNRGNGAPMHTFKRRLNPNNEISGSPDMNIYRFERTAQSLSHDHVAMEHVTVRIYEITSSASRKKRKRPECNSPGKLMQTITISCCVLPTGQPSQQDIVSCEALLQSLRVHTDKPELLVTEQEKSWLAMDTNNCHLACNITPDKVSSNKLQRLVL